MTQPSELGVCRGAGGGGYCITVNGWNHSFVVVTLGGWVCGLWSLWVVGYLDMLYISGSSWLITDLKRKNRKKEKSTSEDLNTRLDLYHVLPASNRTVVRALAISG